MRSTIQFPAGGVQSSEPSASSCRSGRSHRLRHDELRRNVGIGDRIEVPRVRKPGAFLKFVNPRAAGQHQLCNVWSCSRTPAGCAGNTRRKYRAVTASNATVRSTKAAERHVGDHPEVRPSSLASSRGRNRVARMIKHGDRIAQARQRNRLNRLRMSVIEQHPGLVCPPLPPAIRAPPYSHRHQKARPRWRSAA